MCKSGTENTPCICGDSRGSDAPMLHNRFLTFWGILEHYNI